MNTEQNNSKQYSGRHFLPRQYAESLLVMDRGSGTRLWDAGGKEYLDFASGIAVNALGYGNKELAGLIAEQAEKLLHISNLFTTEATLALAEKLCSASPRAEDQPWKMGKNPAYFASVHFGNSGSEANEAAIKYARVWQKRCSTGGWRILAFENSFHGRTMGSLSLTWTEKYRSPFEPLVPGTIFAKYNDCEALQSLLSEESTIANTSAGASHLSDSTGATTTLPPTTSTKLANEIAAIIVEPVQGEGGLHAMTAEFAQCLNRLCRERSILLIADEVQTGLGRCGTLFASERVGLEPHIITLSKPLAGGLPLSATLIQSSINDILQAGDHASTFGGGPVTTLAAGYIWNAINAPGFLADVRSRANYLEQGLVALRAEFPQFFADVELRGAGLLRGIVLQNAEELPQLIAGAMEAGLLVLRSGANVLRLAPPLVVETLDIDEMLSILRKCIQKLKR